MLNKEQVYKNRSIITLISLFFIFILLWKIGIRFSHPRLNYLAVGIMLLIPTACLLLHIRYKSIKNTIIKILLILLSIITMFLFMGWLFLVTVWLPDILIRNKDLSFELLKSETINNNTIRVYRTNGGATTNFGIVVREEKQLLPGIYQIKFIGSEYPAYDAHIILDKDDIVIDYE